MSSMTSEKMTYTERRLQVAEMYLNGDNQYDIAAHFGVTQPTISNDLKAIRLQWQADYAATFDTLVTEQLVKIDKMEREAWVAWEASKQPEEVTLLKGKTAEAKPSYRETTTSNRDGNPQFLQVVQRCIDMRLKIIGGYAKDKRDDRRMQNEERWITEAVKALQTGRIKPEQALELWPDMAARLFTEAGLDVSTG